MKAMVLAAGFGTRFRPVTLSTPKPMVPLCNRPLIAWAVDALITGAGADEIVVNLHHLPEAIETYLLREFGTKATFHFSHEQEILGTGGGIRRVRALLEKEEDFLLVNGDTIQWPPFDRLVAARRRDDALAALTLRHPPRGDRYTSVFLDEGRVTGFGSGEGEPLMFSGSHCISRRIFELLPDRDFSGITEDVYFPVTKHGTDRLNGIVHDGPWFDIGTPLRYMTATDAVRTLILGGRIPLEVGQLAERGSLLAANASVAGAIDSAVLGSGVRIDEAARVERSSVWDRATVGRGARVTDSIVAFDAVIPPGAEIVNMMVAVATGREEAGVKLGDLICVPIDPEHTSLARAR